MSISLSVPEDLAREIQRTAETLNESQSTVLRRAICAGLPALGQSASRPEGYFASAYEDYPDERAAAEAGSTRMPTPPDSGRE